MNRGACLAVVACILAGSGRAGAQIPEQYPSPLIHTPANHPADRVLIVDIPGLDAIDLAVWISVRPQSSLAELSRRGVTYTNARVPWPDSAAGLLAIATGGSPISTGIFSSDGYDRALSSAADCATRGAPLDLDGPSPTPPRNPATGCSPVTPHALVRVNSIFDQVHAAGGRTAWADELPAYADLLRGPSGNALDEVFVPHSIDTANQSLGVADQARTNAVLRWIDGRDSTGSSSMAVPRLFGMSLTGLRSVRHEGATPHSEGPAPAASFEGALETIDRQLGGVIAELKKAGLNDSTWIVVTARQGHRPSAIGPVRRIDTTRLEAVAAAAAPGEIAHITADSVASIWLKHPSSTGAVLRAYRAKTAELGIAEIYDGQRLSLIMNSAAEDTRMPDLVLEPQAGVLWGTGNTGRSRMHGGFSDEETHVALLVSGRQLTGRIDKTPVPITQIAPLIQRILGMEKLNLQALHQEHTPALPGIF